MTKVSKINVQGTEIMASINELTILSNLESMNAILIQRGMDKNSRLKILRETAQNQRRVLDKVDVMRSIKKMNDTTYINKKLPENQ